MSRVKKSGTIWRIMVESLLQKSPLVCKQRCLSCCATGAVQLALNLHISQTAIDGTFDCESKRLPTGPLITSAGFFLGLATPTIEKSSYHSLSSVRLSSNGHAFSAANIVPLRRLSICDKPTRVFNTMAAIPLWPSVCTEGIAASTRPK
jgi:hypothetical protein